MTITPTRARSPLGATPAAMSTLLAAIVASTALGGPAVGQPVDQAPGWAPRGHPDNLANGKPEFERSRRQAGSSSTASPEVRAYSPRTGTGTVIVLVSPPSTAGLEDWTARAALQPYNFDFAHAVEQQGEASRWFTAIGWQGFSGSDGYTGMTRQVAERRMVCTAEAERPASLQEGAFPWDAAGSVPGAPAWRVDIPVRQLCQTPSEQVVSRLMLSAVVVRMNSAEHPEGLAIAQLTASEQP